MSDHRVNKEGKTFFTLYFKDRDLAVDLLRHELANLVKEAITLLELSGERHNLIENENSRNP